MFQLLFPPKCVLCKKILSRQETDLCHSCREKAPIFRRSKNKIPFVAHWTALWYYKEDVKSSIHRFKFGGRRNYAETYSRLLGLKLQNSVCLDADIITWVPVSFRRRWKRGYDQTSLTAQALSRELGIPCKRLLRKIRHTPPQSGIHDAAKRRANVLGAYRVTHLKELKGKTVLLIDDVVTTRSTASECAKTLMVAGANQVHFAAVAAVQND